MASQVRRNIDTSPLVLKGGVLRQGFTVAQYATGVLPAGTIMGQVTADSKLLPLTNLAATGGSKFPKYILVEEVDATAGDVTEVNAYIQGYFAETHINLENSLSLDTGFITLATDYAVTVRQALRMMGMIIEATQYIDEYENA